MKSPNSDHEQFGAANLLKAIVCGGLVVAFLDAVNATTFWHLYRGLHPGIIFQSIAAGLLGKKAAFSGGAPAAWLGAGLHCIIGFGVAAVYCAACKFWPGLLKKPFVSGAIYGVVVYLVMNYVVIPLSQTAAGRFNLAWFLADFLGHILLIGVPVAYVVRRVLTDGQPDHGAHGEIQH